MTGIFFFLDNYLAQHVATATAYGNEDGHFATYLLGAVLRFFVCTMFSCIKKTILAPDPC